jgi:putative ABC transport system ATP-binding protein
MLSTRPLIELNEVVKTYQMGTAMVRALNGIDLTIRQGEYVAIMGASGSGKTTLMDIIGCLDTPTSGICVVDGKSIKLCTEDQLATLRNNTVGFIFQQFNLLSQMTALQNVMLPLLYSGVPLKERVKRAEEVLRLVGLGDRLQHRPSELSGGQQQRVSIARALANRPKLLLADEPTGALDSVTADEIMLLIGQLALDGMTVIIVTHDPATAERAQKIIRVKDGKIIT